MRISDWSSDVCSSDLENLEARSEHLMPHRGQFIVVIVEIDANAVNQPSKPGDEVVVVMNGILRLTTDEVGAVTDILAGEAVLIPAGRDGFHCVTGERCRVAATGCVSCRQSDGEETS